MLRVIRIAPAHDSGSNDGIDFDAGNIWAAIGYSAENIDTSARPDDGELPMRPQDIGQSGRSGHEIGLPVGVVPLRDVRIHDVGGGISVDDNHLALSLAIDFYARECVPVRKFHP